jgi:hypothetical protein
MANKNKPPAETQQIMSQMLADNAKAAQAVIDGAQKERDRAAADRLSAKERLKALKNDKHNLLEAYYQKALKKLKKEIRDKEQEKLASELLEFIGKRAVRDKANGHQFRIDDNAIVILKEKQG